MMRLFKCVLADRTAFVAMVLALAGCIASFILAEFAIGKEFMMILQVLCFMFSISNVSTFGKRVNELQHELDRKSN